MRQMQRYIWQYSLSHLRSSADDGCMRLQLVLRSREQLPNRGKENAPSSGGSHLSLTKTEQPELTDIKVRCVRVSC